jgi:DNA gyrase/topoisomerase IV subunit A
MDNTNEKLEPVKVADEASRSFLDYSITMIISPGLPDAR